MTKKRAVASPKRRTGIAAALAAVAAASVFSPQVMGQAKEIKVAVIAPISGPWARPGQLIQMGAQMAVDEINATGGIKSQGGAKLKLVVADAGDTAEKAKNAAQRLIASEPDTGGRYRRLAFFLHPRRDGSDRAGADSVADPFVFRQHHRSRLQVCVPDLAGGQRAVDGLDPGVDGTGETGHRQGARHGWCDRDNTASSVFFLKPLREGGLTKFGLKTLMDETYTPPLSDATPLIQKVRTTKPEMLIFASTTISDLKLGLEKMNEFRLGKGAIPVIANGAHMGAPDVLKNIPADLLEGSDLHRRRLESQGRGVDQ